MSHCTSSPGPEVLWLISGSLTARLRRGSHPVGLVPWNSDADLAAIYTRCTGGGMGEIRGSGLKSLRLSHLWYKESGSGCASGKAKG